jgi:hypothetical protein
MSIYWQIGDKKTKSKTESLLLAEGDLSKITFHLHDDEWKNKEYTIEPEKSFAELAINRCNFLREKTSWLSLWLSSGYDSYTILEYFKISKAKLDEIVIYRRGEWDQEHIYSQKMASEYKKNYNSKCVINVFVMPYDQHSKIYESIKEDWIFAPGLSARFSKTTPSWISYYPGEGMKILDKNSSNRIDINGFDKPRVDLYDDKWFASYPDTATVDMISDRFTAFYIDPIDFDFYIKQHYMVIKWFESLTNLSNELVHAVQSHKIHYKEWNIACGRLDPKNSWSSDGYSKKLHSHNDQSLCSTRLQKHFINSKGFQYYNEGLKIIKNSCHWWNTGEDLAVKSNLTSAKKFLRNLKKNEK